MEKNNAPTGKELEKEIVAARLTLEATKDELAMLQARSAFVQEEIERLRNLPDDLEKKVRDTLALYVKGKATEAQLKSARAEAAALEVKLQETIELEHAIGLAINETIARIPFEDNVILRLTARKWSLIRDDFGSQLRSSGARNLLIYILAADGLCPAGTPFVVDRLSSSYFGDLIIKALWPDGRIDTNEISAASLELQNEFK